MTLIAEALPRTSAKRLSPRMVAVVTMAAASLLLMLFAESTGLFALVTAIACIIAGAELYAALARPAGMRFLRVLALGVLLGYAGGTLVFLIANSTFDAASIQYWEPYGMYYSQATLSQAMGLALLASAVLVALSAWESPVDVQQLASSVNPTELLVVLIGGTLTVVIAAATGQFGYQGTIFTSGSGVSVLGSLAGVLAPALLPYATFTMSMPASDRRHRLISGAVAAVLLFLLAVMGRRYLIYAVLLAVVARRLAVNQPMRRRGPLYIIGLVVLVPLLAVGFYFFFALRQIQYRVAPDASLYVQSREAISLMTGADGRTIRDDFGNNLATRPFILSYLAGLHEQGSDATPLSGEEFANAVRIAIPSVLSPDKENTVLRASEELAHPYYGLLPFDGPDSVIVSGFHDFRTAGVVLYPIALALIFRTYLKIASVSIRSASAVLLVLWTLLFGLLYIENSLASFVVLLRNLTLVVVFMSIVRLRFRSAAA